MASEEGADEILRGQHSLKNSTVDARDQIDVKPALDREEAKKKAERERQRKVFVGGLPKNLPDEKLELYFSKFGEIQKSYVVKDPYSGKTRGFGFVIFENDAGFEKARRHPNHRIEGQEVHIKTAQAKEEESAPGLSNERDSQPGSASRESNLPGPEPERHARTREPFSGVQARRVAAPQYPDEFEADFYPPPAYHFLSQKFQPHEGYYGPALPGFGMQFYSMTDVSPGERGRGCPPGPQQSGGHPRRPAALQRFQPRAHEPVFADPGYPSHRQARPESNLQSVSSQRDCNAPSRQPQGFSHIRNPPHPQSLQGRFDLMPQAMAAPDFFDPSYGAPGYFGSGQDFVRPLPPPVQHHARGGFRPSPVSDQAIAFTRPHKPVPSYVHQRSERIPPAYFPHHPQVFNYDDHWKHAQATKSTLPSFTTNNPHQKLSGKPDFGQPESQSWPGEDEADEEGHLQRAPDF